MNVKLIPSSVTGKIGLKVLKAKSSSPRTLFVIGIASVATSTVLACKATLKVEEVLDEIQDDFNTIKQGRETVPDERYSDMDARKDTIITYVGAVRKFAVLYGPAIVVGGFGVACLTGSHNILSKRNAGLSAALTATTKAFQEYRARVIDEFGEEKEREIHYDMTNRVVSWDGDKPVEARTVDRETPQNASMYAKFFNSQNKNWNPNIEYNIVFLRAQQTIFNDLLYAKGVVLLNDVYDALGLERTTAGCVVGWVKGMGDDYVSFGVFDRADMRILDWMIGAEGEILLDFNCMGDVHSYVDHI